ncbi:MAG TPA: helix-turn-helix domain-containing protein [Chloroflexia bacterium]|nr:helix-turn-helix domain-containing protein [Chloroflexia bacterium]
MDDEPGPVGSDQPAEVFTVDTLETLKVLTDPLRLQICELLLHEPLTVKQLAAELDTPATKLYYHVNLLEEHRLIKVVSTRIVSGIIEKQYRVSAYRLDVDPSLFSQQLDGGEGTGLTTAVDSVFDSTKRDIKRSIRTGLIDPANSDPEHRTTMMLKNLTRLSRERAEEFARRLDALCKDFDDLTSTNAQDNVYGLMIAFYPTHQHRPEEPVQQEGKENER